jgi:hypothetical protein
MTLKLAFKLTTVLERLFYWYNNLFLKLVLKLALKCLKNVELEIIYRKRIFPVNLGVKLYTKTNVKLKYGGNDELP